MLIFVKQILTSVCYLLTIHHLHFRGGAEETERGVQCGVAETGAGEGAQQVQRTGAEDQRHPEIQVVKRHKRDLMTSLSLWIAAFTDR